MPMAGTAPRSGAYLCTIAVNGMIMKILNRRLPGVRIDPPSIAALSRELEAATFQNTARRLALIAAAFAVRIMGIDALAQFGPTAAKFAQVERKVLTLFILGSDFLDVRDPKSDLVTYNAAPEECTNRFAQYDN
jgi:hypothetical protein